jgi:CubicO group peptidase (beta-lactamase class C family)
MEMRKKTAFVLAILAALVALAQNGAAPDIRSLYDGKLPPDAQVDAFRHIDRFFSTRVVHRGRTASVLMKGSATLDNFTFLSDGRQRDLFDYLSLNRVAGLLVLKDRKIAYEDYELGAKPQDRWASWSIVKSISSTLVGAAIRDGYISGLDAPLTKYLHELSGSAYDGTTVRQLLQMSSGVQWNETYTDPKSDRRRMLDLQIEQKPGAILQFMATLPRARAPGSVWNYNTGETHVIGALLRAAVKRPLSEYLSQKIWSRVGMEDDATWWLESPGGLEVAGSGLSARLRDYGRFGQFVLDDGRVGNEHIVPDGWFQAAGSPRAIGGNPVSYGYMWWAYGNQADPVHQGAFLASGIFGQSLYINPRERVVIVVWSARPKPTGTDTIEDDDFFAGVVKSLREQSAR